MKYKINNLKYYYNIKINNKIIKLIKEMKMRCGDETFA